MNLTTTRRIQQVLAARGKKRCNRCRHIKPLDDFYPKRTPTRVSYNNWCKACVNAPDQQRMRLLRNHGISEERHAALLSEQGGTCAICGRVPMDGALEIDHDHACCPGGFSCGLCIRGLLCRNCNVGLGQFRDDPALLAAAIHYVSRMTDDRTNRVS